MSRWIGHSVLTLGAIAAACHDGPTRPRDTATLALAYAPPAIEAPVPPAAALACTHHYAPQQRVVETSWGERARVADDGGIVRLGPVRTRHQLWIRLIDVAWCAADPSAPVARRGLTVNGIELRHLVAVEGELPALGFTVSHEGVVRP